MPSHSYKDLEIVRIKIISDSTDISLPSVFKTCEHLTIDSWDKGASYLSQQVLHDKTDILYLASPGSSKNLLALCKALQNLSNTGLSVFIISSPKREDFIRQAYSYGVKAFIDIPIIDVHFEQQLLKCSQNILHQKHKQQSNRRKAHSHQLAKLCDFTWNATLQNFNLSPEAKELLGIKESAHRISQHDFLQSLHEIGRLTFAHFLDSVKKDQIDITTRIQAPLHTAGYSDILLTAQLDEHEKSDLIYHGYFQNISSFNNRQGSSHHLTYHDSLTGLANRRYLMEHLQNLILQSKKENFSFSVLFLDLDGFKQINDQFGHATGDLLLVEVTQYLQNSVSESEFIARLGGDEFCIALKHKKHSNHGEQLAQKIIKGFKYSLFLEQFKIHTSFSIGVARFPNHGKNITELLKAADTAMYEAKSKGKNCYELYTSLLTEKTLERITLEKELYLAYKQEQFELFYQPQISLQSQKIVGLEALIRWIHPIKGMISPNKFISVLEETRQINKIGEWVLNKACTDAKILHDKGLPITIAVNVSPIQLHYGNFYEKVANALMISGLEPQFLELEITESSFQISDSNIDVFSQLRQLGVQLAIDDFGTGYSNLTSLNKLPIDIVKIDREFIKDIPQDHAIAALTASIIGMAKMKQLKIIAEGIETREQIQYLQSINCDIAQGYYIGHPMEFSQIAMFLKRQQEGSSILLELKGN